MDKGTEKKSKLFLGKGSKEFNSKTLADIIPLLKNLMDAPGVISSRESVAEPILMKPELLEPALKIPEKGDEWETFKLNLQMAPMP